MGVVKSGEERKRAEGKGEGSRLHDVCVGVPYYLVLPAGKGGRSSCNKRGRIDTTEGTKRGSDPGVGAGDVGGHAQPSATPAAATAATTTNAAVL